MSKLLTHPTSVLAKEDKATDRENLARQMRTTQMMREAAREQISPTQLINDLFEIDTKLAGEKDPAGNPIPLEREVIAALRARADIKFRLMGKVLPDIKATESISHNMHDHAHQHTHNVSNVELAQRLQLWRKQQGLDESCLEATFKEVNDEYDFI